MSTPAIVGDIKLQMGMQIRNGPWQHVPLRSKDIHPSLVFANEQQAMRAASYETLADRLIADKTWAESRQIFVTSPMAGDGKTTTAFNLAYAFSKRAQPVLLVELNLQAPGLRTTLGNPRIRYGIDSLLRKIATEQESVFTLVSDDLYIGAVRDAMSRTEIKRFQPALGPFLKWAREEFEWVILDCPPVLSRHWDEWFKENATSVLMVVRSERTPGIYVRSASRKLKGSLKGAVLSRAGIDTWNPL